MHKPKLSERIKHAWNAFRNRDPTEFFNSLGGYSQIYRSERRRAFVNNERSIIQALYNRISMDVAAQKILHVNTDEEGRYISTRTSGLNTCLTLEANIDQTGRELIQDIISSLFDEGTVAVVPVDTTLNPIQDGGYDINSLRVGRIIEWYPRYVKVDLYNDQTGEHKELTFPKHMCAIIQNPFYSVMNTPNGIFQRLIRKLNQLDAVDEQSSSGKLDIIIQLPYVVRSDLKKQQAEERRKNLEDQMKDSKYGIGYIDGTERITQLNRAAENNMMSQIEYLTSMLFSQLGLPKDIFDGTADERTMLNYQMSTIEPLVASIINEFKRKFLTKTARTQGQTIMYFKRVLFAYATTMDIANAADKFSRNEILTSNELRSELGYKPSEDPSSDKLQNRNINPPKSEDVIQKEIELMDADIALKRAEVKAAGGEIADGEAT